MRPVAEDFRAASGLGASDRSVGLQDVDGVNLAGVKALEARTAELRAALEELKARTERVNTLEAELAEMKRRLDRLGAGTS